MSFSDYPTFFALKRKKKYILKIVCLHSGGGGAALLLALATLVTGVDGCSIRCAPIDGIVSSFVLSTIFERAGHRF